MILFAALFLLAVGVYATLLGFGKTARPASLRGHEGMLWLGRFALLFGALCLMDVLGYSPHVISTWLEDILTSGGGAGTG